MKTMDKRNDYSQLLEKRTMMVHADLNDKLQRDILVKYFILYRLLRLRRILAI